MTRDQLIEKAAVAHANVILNLGVGSLYSTIAMEAAVDVVLEEVLREPSPYTSAWSVLEDRRKFYCKPVDPRIAIVTTALRSPQNPSSTTEEIARRILVALDTQKETQ